MKNNIIYTIVFVFTISTTQAQVWKKLTGDNKTTDTTKVEKKAGGGLFQNIVAKVAKVAGNAAGGMSGMVSTVDNLQNVDILASVGTNIYSKDLGLIVNDFLGDEWINNGDFTMIMLSSKNSFKLNKYAGTIKVNNKELKHSSFGVHTFCENPNSGNKKIAFEKNGVLEGSFEVPLPKNNIKLISVNGQKSNPSLDLTKDVTLEFANFSTQKDALIRVDMICTTIGLRSLYLVAYVKPAAKVVIPFQAFRNIETTNKGFTFKNSYIAVSEQFSVKTINNTGFFKTPIDALTGSNDGMWVNVTNKGEQFYGYNLESETSGIKTKLEKGNAAFSMPMAMAKKIAVATMSIQGTTYSHGTKTDKLQNTITETTIQFPQIPDAWLDETLAEMYKKFTTTVAEVTSGVILPETAIPSSPSYENVQQFFLEEKNTNENFLKSYKGLNPIKPLSTSSFRLQGENALLSETKSDALLKIKLNIDLGENNGKVTMNPYLSVELDGASNGGFRSAVGNTKYFTINLSGEPIDVKQVFKKKGEGLTKELYQQIVQMDAFNAALKKTVMELKEKEKLNTDYEIIWNLQK